MKKYVFTHWVKTKAGKLKKYIIRTRVRIGRKRGKSV